ncbi:MAG: hypothetical protein E4H20_02265 [Spirochaetales bacterium]|nr:MAG: hypothetical protein E4H20_02265 [Spirochaetales bacterium]
MKGRASAILALAAAISAFPAVASPGSISANVVLPFPSSGYEYREGLAPCTKLSELVAKPTIIELENYVFKDPASGERRMTGFTDVHAIYDFPIEAFIAANTDYANYFRFVPRIFSSDIQTRTPGQCIMKYTVGISFLGFRVAYETLQETRAEPRADGSFLSTSRLLDSPDGKLFEHYTSLYLATVIVDGKAMTYVRYFNRPGVRNPFPGMLTVSRTFTPGESRAQVTALAKEAAKRIVPKP